mgnify:CR=1 FL=1
MARNRVFQLRNNLHLVNILDRSENCEDRVYKVCSMYDAICKRCLELPLKRVLCIDEQIGPFQGQLNVKQYVEREGVKVFVLCAKSRQAYHGSTAEVNKDMQKMYNFAPAMILHLCERISAPGHDSYFSSYSPLQILKTKSI